MRRTRQETARSRERIVAAAARMVRAQGIDALSVVDVMRAAGMTHGGFYRHFPSKEALVSEALDAAFDDVPDALTPKGDLPPRRALEAYVARYLEEGHLDHPEIGCPVAALGSDVMRASRAARDAFARRTEQMIDVVADGMGPARGVPRDNAIRLLTSMIGAVVLARSVEDKALVGEILETTREYAGDLFGRDEGVEV